MKGYLLLKRLLKAEHAIPVLVVVIFSLLASRGLIGEGYFNMHDDLQMMRQLEMEKCFLDLQIPCRWVPDMGYGFGYPLFNFYPPLPYLIGQAIRIVGYSFMDTIKIVFILSFIVSGIGMYFLSSKFFGKLGGIISSIFYLWAPYHAVDTYVRGAMNEAWALAWFPLILWTAYSLIDSKDKKIQLKWVIGLALSWFALMTSHNLMVIIFAPLFAAWCLIWVTWKKNILSIVYLIKAGVLAFGLAAFFTLPVFLEKNIVQTNTLVVGYYEYTAHFASIGQLLFSRFWGYGPSVWMTQDDRMSFQIGWIHWGTSILVGLLAVFKLVKTRKLSPAIIATFLLLATGWFAAFMAHPKSIFIWQAIEELKFVQFPWRFLTLVILAFSFIAGSLAVLLPVSRTLISSVLVLVVIIYSWNYFLPEHGKLGPLSDQEKFTGAAWELQQTAGIYDYLPNTAITAPKEPRKELIDIVSGQGEVINPTSGTNWAKAQLEMNQESTLRINIMDFPEWRITVDGSPVEKYIPDEEQWGRMYVNIPEGNHELAIKLYDTPIRRAGNIISLISWIALGIVFYKQKHEYN